MCGRFTLAKTKEELQEAFPGILFDEDWPMEPRYNIGPGEEILVASMQFKAGRMHWGFLPHWAKEGGMRPLINARAESLHQKPSFQESFRRRRLIVFADGFYEWANGAQGGSRQGKSPGGKIPHYFTLKGDKPFAMAALWDRWQGRPGLAIATVGANELLAPIHDRMPAMLTPQEAMTWLDPQADERELKALLRPVSPNEMTERQVSKTVNNPQAEGPELTKALIEE